MSNWEELSPQVRELITVITRRLAPVAPHVPPTEFSGLVRQLAEAEVLWAERGLLRPPPPALVARPRPAIPVRAREARTLV